VGDATASTDAGGSLDAATVAQVTDSRQADASPPSRPRLAASDGTARRQGVIDAEVEDHSAGHPSDVNDWRSQARCLGVGPSMFYAERGQPSIIARAMHICANCPVRAECLADALASEIPSELFGVRGGRTPDQRRAIMRRRRQLASQRQRVAV
jgi:Transcription factor WhiB